MKLTHRHTINNILNDHLADCPSHDEASSLLPHVHSEFDSHSVNADP